MNRWLLPLLWLLLIYSTLSVVRPVSEALRRAGLLNAALIGVIGGLFAGGAFLIRARRLARRASTWGMLAALAAATTFAMAALELPEERIHLPEYAILAALIFRALSAGGAPARAYGLSLMMAALAGWGDEGIQYLLPNRHYDVKDVVLNAAGGLLGLLFVAILRREQGQND